jgi:polysaccharide pyruvyl transferase WcaK-like protein
MGPENETEERDASMTQERKPRTIGIWGHYHGANHGDECTVAAIVQNVRRHCPETQLFGISQKASDTEKRHGMPSFWLRRPEPKLPPLQDGTKDVDWRSARKDKRERPAGRLKPLKDLLRRTLPPVFAVLKGVRRLMRLIAEAAGEMKRLAQSYRHLKGIEMLIVAGSGPVSDEWNGSYGHPYSIFRWSVLAWLRRTKFVFLSVGAGPLKRPLARWMVRWSLKRAHYRSFRDPSSKALIDSMNLGGKNHLYPDLAFSLNFGKIEPETPHPARGKRRMIVGLNPMSHEDPRYQPHGDTERYETYLKKMADFGEWLIRNDYQVVVLYSDIDGDPRACDDLRALLRARPGLELGDQWDEAPIWSFDDMIERMKLCDAIVAARYHCLILPMMMHKPVLALAYHDKTDDLMKSMGQGEYRLHIDRFEPAELIECFQRLEVNRETISEKLSTKVVDCRRALEIQYDALLGPVAEARATKAGRAGGGTDAETTGGRRQAAATG